MPSWRRQLSSLHAHLAERGSIGTFAALHPLHCCRNPCPRVVVTSYQLHLTNIPTAVRIGQLGRGGQHHGDQKGRTPHQTGGPDPLPQQSKTHEGGPQGLTGVQNLRPGGSHRLLPPHLQQGRQRVDGQTAPEDHAGDDRQIGAARRLSQKFERGFRGKGDQHGHRQDRLRDDFGRDQWQGCHLALSRPVKESQIVRGVQDGGGHAGQISREGGVRRTPGILRDKQKDPRQGQANGGPDALGNGHAHDALRERDQEGRQLDQKGAVTGGGETETENVEQRAQHFPRAEFEAGLEGLLLLLLRHAREQCGQETVFVLFPHTTDAAAYFNCLLRQRRRRRLGGVVCIIVVVCIIDNGPIEKGTHHEHGHERHGAAGRVDEQNGWRTGGEGKGGVQGGRIARKQQRDKGNRGEAPLVGGCGGSGIALEIGVCWEGRRR